MQFKTVFLSIASIVTCGLIFGQGEGAEDKRPSKGAAQTIDSFIAQQMDEAGIAGLAAAVLVDKKVVWMKGYGFADKERGIPSLHEHLAPGARRNKAPAPYFSGAVEVC